MRVRGSMLTAVALALASVACGEPIRADLVASSSSTTGSPALVTSDGSSSGEQHGDTTRVDTASGSIGDDPATSTGSDSTGPSPRDATPLQVKFLGVGGVSVRYRDDVWITAPLYTNPDFFATTFGDVASDPAIIDQFLPLAWIEPARAILVGHAHYDHLMDVPYVWTKTDDAIVYGNASVAHLLAAAPEIPSDRIVALNDPESPLVDRRMCDAPDPCTGIPANDPGQWIEIPGLSARMRALCSTHPAQFLGVVHFGEGCMTADVDTLPLSAADWREGSTIAYLVDVLDEDSGDPIYRIYYQDAPTDPPFGHPDPSLLADKRVDLAILNVGSFTQVAAHPESIIDALDPRYVLAIHWENFFAPQSVPLGPIPFHPDPAEFDMRALASLPDDPQTALIVGGRALDVRYLRPAPGDEIELFAAD